MGIGEDRVSNRMKSAVFRSSLPLTFIKSWDTIFDSWLDVCGNMCLPIASPTARMPFLLVSRYLFTLSIHAHQVLPDNSGWRRPELDLRPTASIIPAPDSLIMPFSSLSLLNYKNKGGSWGTAPSTSMLSARRKINSCKS